jgi:very-short-patch-repair endonuclease
MTSFEQEFEKAGIIQGKYDCRIIFDKYQEPYTLYNANDIAKLLGYNNIRALISTYNENEKKKIITETEGGSQYVLYLTWKGLQKMLLKSRKTTSIEFSKLLDIDKKMEFYTCVETDVIKCLLKTFDCNIMIPQYKVGIYYIDLYFPEYLLAIEIDEKHHNNPTNVIKDSTRTQYIIQQLGCRFIRCKPYEKNFDLFSFINNIYIHLSVAPRQKI